MIRERPVDVKSNMTKTPYFARFFWIAGSRRPILQAFRESRPAPPLQFASHKGCCKLVFQYPEAYPSGTRRFHRDAHRGQKLERRPAGTGLGFLSGGFHTGTCLVEEHRRSTG